MPKLEVLLTTDGPLRVCLGRQQASITLKLLYCNNGVIASKLVWPKKSPALAGLVVAVNQRTARVFRLPRRKLKSSLPSGPNRLVT